MVALIRQRAILPDDPIAPLLDAMAERDARMEALVREFRDKLDGARGLTAEGERDLVQRIGREVGSSLARRARADVLRTGLLGVAVLSGAMGLAGAVCYGVGRAQGGDLRIAQICTGAAVQVQAGDGLSCSFWIKQPTKEERR